MSRRVKLEPTRSPARLVPSPPSKNGRKRTLAEANKLLQHFAPKEPARAPTVTTKSSVIKLEEENTESGSEGSSENDASSCQNHASG
jgi:hypothetical protein